MVNNKQIKTRVTSFFLGMLTVVAMLFLTGAAKDTVIDNGRYQISAWGDGKAHGAFVVDTISGETKIAYRYKELENSKFIERNNLNKPFSAIK